MNTMFSRRAVPDVSVQHIVEIIDEYSAVPIRSDKTQKMALTENLLVLNYLHAPEMPYAECLAAIQPDCPYPIEPSYLRRIAEENHLDHPGVRVALAEWAYRTAELLYAGMAGDSAAFEQAMHCAESSCLENDRCPHSMQSRFLLFAMFEFIPELHEHPSCLNLRKLGRKYCRVCLNQALNSLAFDLRSADSASDPIPGKDNNTPDQLRREVYLAKRELEEYKKMVESADTDFETRLESRCREEIAEFFRSLNDPRYGHLIDSVYLQNRACTEFRRNGETLPYLLEGVPGLLERMLRFFRDSAIAPACKFPPNSLQKLTVQQMEGCQFEPLPTRTVPLTRDSVVTVRVISSGWRYGDTVISSPILREEKTSR